MGQDTNKIALCIKVGFKPARSSRNAFGALEERFSSGCVAPTYMDQCRFDQCVTSEESILGHKGVQLGLGKGREGLSKVACQHGGGSGLDRSVQRPSAS